MKNFAYQLSQSACKDLSISEVVNSYSIENIVSQLCQVSWSTNTISINVVSLTNLEVLHKRIEIELELKNTLLFKNNLLKAIENRVERKVNHSISFDSLSDSTLLKQRKIIGDIYPEKLSIDLQKSLASQSHQSLLPANLYSSIELNILASQPLSINSDISSDTLALINKVNSRIKQVVPVEKIKFLRSENIVSNILEAKQVQLIGFLADQKVSTVKNFDRRNALPLRPEKSTVPNQDQQRKLLDKTIASAMGISEEELNKSRESALKGNVLRPESQETSRQRLISDFASKPFSDREVYDAYKFEKMISTEFRGIDQQHVTAAEAFARRYGADVARALGVGNELGGLAGDSLKALTDFGMESDMHGGMGGVFTPSHMQQRLLERLLNKKTAFELSDLIDNEIGIELAGYTGYSRKILEFIKASPTLYAIFLKEIASNPFKYYAIEFGGRFGLGVSRSIGRSSDRYSLGVSSPTSTSTNRYNLGVNIPSLPPQQTYKTLRQGKINMSNSEGSNQGDKRDRSPGSGGRDAGQKERNRESGHKGYGGPQ